jgi:hypothetical protein
MEESFAQVLVSNLAVVAMYARPRRDIMICLCVRAGWVLGGRAAPECMPLCGQWRHGHGHGHGAIGPNVPSRALAHYRHTLSYRCLTTVNGTSVALFLSVRCSVGCLALHGLRKGQL